MACVDADTKRPTSPLSTGGSMSLILDMKLSNGGASELGSDSFSKACLSGLNFSSHTSARLSRDASTHLGTLSVLPAFDFFTAIHPSFQQSRSLSTCVRTELENLLLYMWETLSTAASRCISGPRTSSLPSLAHLSRSEDDMLSILDVDSEICASNFDTRDAQSVLSWP